LNVTSLRICALMDIPPAFPSAFSKSRVSFSFDSPCSPSVDPCVDGSSSTRFRYLAGNVNVHHFCSSGAAEVERTDELFVRGRAEEEERLCLEIGATWSSSSAMPTESWRAYATGQTGH
jgi:hypothetical protein